MPGHFPPQRMWFVALQEPTDGRRSVGRGYRLPRSATRLALAFALPRIGGCLRVSGPGPADRGATWSSAMRLGSRTRASRRTRHRQRVGDRGGRQLGQSLAHQLLDHGRDRSPSGLRGRADAVGDVRRGDERQGRARRPLARSAAFRRPPQDTSHDRRAQFQARRDRLRREVTSSQLANASCVLH